jgi:hypothetical protein
VLDGWVGWAAGAAAAASPVGRCAAGPGSWRAYNQLIPLPQNSDPGNGELGGCGGGGELQRLLGGLRRPFSRGPDTAILRDSVAVLPVGLTDHPTTSESVRSGRFSPWG